MERRSFLTAAGAAGLAMTAQVSAAAPEGAAPARGDEEPPLDPGLPIIDPHHHMWDFPPGGGNGRRRYLLPDVLADIARGGHTVTHTVFMESNAMYRADGPEALRVVGETEFVNGAAAMSASGIYGQTRVAAGIVGNANLRLGDGVQAVLDAHVAAGNGRFRGIRMGTAWADVAIFGRAMDPARRGILMDRTVREGFAALAPRGLSFDTWCFHTQLGEVADLAGAFPDTSIILDHIGTPLLIGPYAERREEVFAAWRAGIRALAQRPNVSVKLGGLGMDLSVPTGTLNPATTSEKLAADWRPYIETCIEVFGTNRCMFESNFPPDESACSYGTLWNVFKRITSAYSAAEKADLFSSTAARIYRL